MKEEGDGKIFVDDYPGAIVIGVSQFECEGIKALRQNCFLIKMHGPPDFFSDFSFKDICKGTDKKGKVWDANQKKAGRKNQRKFYLKIGRK